MKKLCYLLFILAPFASISQVEDSLVNAIREQGLNLLVIEPGEDPNGAQSRPCGTFVVSVNACCHVYRVICGGVVKWESELFCSSTMCNTVFKFILSSMVIPTVENPLTEHIPFDMSILVDKESITEEEVQELRENYAAFYFEVENDILLENEGFYVLYKSGNYTIKQGEMVMKIHLATY